MLGEHTAWGLVMCPSPVLKRVSVPLALADRASTESHSTRQWYLERAGLAALLGQSQREKKGRR